MCAYYMRILHVIMDIVQMISKSAKRQYSDFPPGRGRRMMKGSAFCCSSSCAIRYPSMIFLSTGIMG